MKRRYVVIGVACAAVAAGTGGTWSYREWAAAGARDAAAREQDEKKLAFLYRDHAPILGPTDAKVTITEFFDPSSETCRTFYSIVKQILRMNEGRVRVVLRYAAPNQGSEQAVRILEAARLQDKFIPVVEVLLARQANWAMHDGPDIDMAWAIAGEAGLDVATAKLDAESKTVTALLAQDAADVAAIGLKRTPTFFVNGKLLTDLGSQQLYDLVADALEVSGN